MNIYKKEPGVFPLGKLRGMGLASLFFLERVCQVLQSLGPFYTRQFESVQYSLVLIKHIILVCLLPILGTKRSVIASVMFWRHQRQEFETEKQS